MARKYDSSKRIKAAEQTRKDILRAELKLHWKGITEFDPLAREAGCSVATLRKHFPTREALFQNCTRAFAETVTMPDLLALEEISNVRLCLARCATT
jgi:AcrR family transcriptional regulator